MTRSYPPLTKGVHSLFTAKDVPIPEQHKTTNACAPDVRSERGMVLQKEIREILGEGCGKVRVRGSKLKMEPSGKEATRDVLSSIDIKMRSSLQLNGNGAAHLSDKSEQLLKFPSILASRFCAMPYASGSCVSTNLSCIYSPQTLIVVPLRDKLVLVCFRLTFEQILECG